MNKKEERAEELKKMNSLHEEMLNRGRDVNREYRNMRNKVN